MIKNLKDKILKKMKRLSQTNFSLKTLILYGPMGH